MIELTLGSIFLAFVATVVVAILLSRPPRGVDQAVTGTPDQPAAALAGAVARAHHGVAELVWAGVETDESRLIAAVAALTAAWGLDEPA